MRKLLVLLVAALSLAALPAAADRASSGGRGGPGAGAYQGQGGQPGPGYRAPGGYHRYGGYHGGSYYPWAGLVLFSAIAGFALSAESSRLPAPDPEYGGPALFIERQPEASPYPAGHWYFCQSSALYYPYTKACPEGWQAVAPNPW